MYKRQDPYFKTISRQKQLQQPTSLAGELIGAAMELLRSNWKKTDPIRLLTITAIQLCDEGEEEQISLFASENKKREKQEKGERTLDAIREKYGGSAITFGGMVNNDIGITKSKEEMSHEKK